MSYVNLNNPANFQLQEFEQLGFRYIVSGRPTISGETYRTIFVLTDAVVTATCPNGDSLSSETLVAGTVIHGFFEDVSVASGSLLAYKAGPITAQEIFDAYKAYVYAQGGIVEGESCAVADIAALLEDKLYSAASLVLIPSGYKVSHLYAERPLDSNGDLTFTRASNATRVGPDGLIEKVRTNIALRSEDQTAWSDQYQTFVTANAAANPINGSVTADKVYPSVILDDHYRGLSMGSVAGEFSSSIYVKADGYSIIDYAVFNSTAVNYPVRAVFDLSTETITQIDGSISSITSVGSGWYRISVSASVASTSTMRIYHRVRSTGTSGTYAGDGTSGMLLWGCQLESGVTTDYVGPTTSAAVSVGPVANLPRLDYLNSSCPSLLLEPQRTNLALYSEQIDNAGWTKTNAPTITTNIATAPDGYGGADGIQDTTGGTFKRIRQTFSVSANSTNTASVFVKKETSQTNFGGLALIHTGGTTAKFAYGIINPIAGTIVVSSDSVIGATSTKVEDYGDWWRFSLTATDNGSNTSVEIAYYATLSTNGTYTGLGAGSVRTVWGFQLEVGASYATSYIPTLGAAVTRLDDACYKTGISSLIGQTEGVFFLDFEKTNNDVQVVQISDGTTQNRIYLGINNTNIIAQVRSGGGAAQAVFTVAATNNTRYKCAIAYKENDFVLYINGNQEGSDTSGLVPASFSQLQTSDIVSSDFINPINQILLFKTRLSNAQLVELTTL